MNGDLKTTFIQKSLAEYMQRVIHAMTIAAQRQKVHFSGDAMRSLSYHLIQQAAGQGVANLKFKEYIRMVDMGAGRGHPLGGLKTMVVTLQASNRSGLIQTKDNTRKAKKIYSKIAYGNLTWLQNQLLYGFTEETIASLKKEMT